MLRRAALGVAFAFALIAVYFTGRGGWPIYTALVVGVSVLGGWMIGRSWAVYLGLAVNIAFSALSVAADVLLFHVDQGHHRSAGEIALIYVGQALVSATATAAAVRLRGSADPIAKPS
jgi:hypothetical protein